MSAIRRAGCAIARWAGPDVSDPVAKGHPRFSVVTVTYNNRSGFERTAQSVQAQTFRDVEWIVVDGASSDDTAAFARTMTAPAPTVVSEPDEGIFDAMTKGLRLARGEFVTFMNAGDCFFDPEVLRRTDEAIGDAPVALIYGDAVEDGVEGQFYKPARSPAANRYVMFTHHQSQFYRTTIAQEIGYDRSYKLSADWVMTTRVLRRGPALRLPFAVSLFERGGVSQRSGHRRTLDHELFRIYREEQGHTLGIAAVYWALKVSVNKARALVPALYDKIRYR